MVGQVVTAWNGMAIGAFANASRVLANEPGPPQAAFPVEGRPAHEYLAGVKRTLHLCPSTGAHACCGCILRAASLWRTALLLLRHAMLLLPW